MRCCIFGQRKKIPLFGFSNITIGFKLLALNTCLSPLLEHCALRLHFVLNAYGSASANLVYSRIIQCICEYTNALVNSRIHWCKPEFILTWHMWLDIILLNTAIDRINITNEMKLSHFNTIFSISGLLVTLLCHAFLTIL